MSNQLLNDNSNFLFAKVLHDIAAPLGALNLCIDDIKKALPESANLIENSIETLSKRIHYWRIMVTSSSTSFSDAAEAIRALARLRDIKIEFSPGNEYQGTYVHLLLAMTMIVIEGLPRGGQIIIDADNGVVIGNGTKCFLHSETHESIIGNVKQPSSRHALGILVYEFAKNCNASVVVEHTSTKLILSLNNSFSNSTNPLGMLWFLAYVY